MKVRVVAAAVLAVAIAFGTAGCNLIQPQATRHAYDPSDGVSVNVGDLQLRNLVVISDVGISGNLLLSATNATGKDVDLEIGWIAQDQVVGGTIIVPSNDKRPTSWGAKGESPLILNGIFTRPGSLVTIGFSSGGESTTALVPVLTSEQPEYKGLAPLGELGSKK